MTQFKLGDYRAIRGNLCRWWSVWGISDNKYCLYAPHINNIDYWKNICITLASGELMQLMVIPGLPGCWTTLCLNSPIYMCIHLQMEEIWAAIITLEYVLEGSISNIMCIIIYLYKIAILHHGMQSFHIISYVTPVYCTLVYCTIADRSNRFVTSISLREICRNELVLKTFDI